MRTTLVATTCRPLLGGGDEASEQTFMLECILLLWIAKRWQACRFVCRHGQSQGLLHCSSTRTVRHWRYMCVLAAVAISSVACGCYLYVCICPCRSGSAVYKFIVMWQSSPARHADCSAQIPCLRSVCIHRALHPVQYGTLCRVDTL